ncbi:growth-regulating factor 3 isoform X2 [Magnolia sinica]|uniref:growth-regulating factor 3 isoform X2 n=1 Tax=Magnolia sinica TaxID=86752 RepID=UPI00265B05F3|nr:growth-regulating factor 3 isoform X2 [Magnolia sinica]
MTESSTTTTQQWRNPHPQPDQSPSAKIPKLLFHGQNQPFEPATTTAAVGGGLSLSVQQPNSSKNSSSLSPFPDPTMTRFPRMGGGFFSLAQWQELELQALIFKYMLAGASVPLDLVLLVRKSLLNSPAFYHHHHNLPLHPQYHHYPPPMLQTGYWGRTVVDSEPGRCRRTDGKKWRCSRDVVSGQKYCERHMHRGRNRSRKPVEIPTLHTAASSGLKDNTIPSAPSMEAAKEAHFTLSGPSPSSNDLLYLNQRSSDGSKAENGSHHQQFNQHDISGEESSGGSKSDGRVLRHFFDDWPRSQQDPSTASSNASSAMSSTHLSISMPRNPSSASSDFSLKLSTGDNELGVASSNAGDRRTNWARWGPHQEASMGGPLAEALRSSTSTTASPTSVLHKPYGSISETSSICT